KGHKEFERILHPTSAIARDRLRSDLGGRVARLNVYNTTERKFADTALLDLFHDEQQLIFALFSPSAARVLLPRLNQLSKEFSYRIASIGPVTSNAVRELGFEVWCEANEYSAEGLAREIHSGLKLDI